MAGKGSKPRPFSVSQEHYASEWDRIFKNQKPDLNVLDKHREKIADEIIWVDPIAGDGDTFEEKVSLSDEMQLHGEKHKPEVK